ncbi:DUF3800 domain-containing protein [Ancylobacter rudongensis]
MYVDESGDPGLNNSPTRYFGLSGIVVHESRWRDFINALISFKKTIRHAYGFPVRLEIHSSEILNKNPYGIAKHNRLAILRNFLDELSKLDYISLTNVIIDKSNKPANYNVFDSAWLTLFQRFENTMKYGNFPGAFRNDHGIVITDATNGKALLRLVRRMSVINYIPNQQHFGPGYRNVPIIKIIEDPHGKDSRDTLPLQAADVCAYFLTQKYIPNSYVRKSGARNYFDRLQPIANVWARKGSALGIVDL